MRPNALKCRERLAIEAFIRAHFQGKEPDNYRLKMTADDVMQYTADTSPVPMKLLRKGVAKSLHNMADYPDKTGVVRLGGGVFEVTNIATAAYLAAEVAPETIAAAASSTYKRRRRQKPTPAKAATTKKRKSSGELFERSRVAAGISPEKEATMRARGQKIGLAGGGSLRQLMQNFENHVDRLVEARSKIAEVAHELDVAIAFLNGSKS